MQAFLILSEPLIDVQGVWEEIPEGTILIAQGGKIDHDRFVPQLHLRSA